MTHVGPRHRATVRESGLGGDVKSVTYLNPWRNVEMVKMTKWKVKSAHGLTAMKGIPSYASLRRVVTLEAGVV